MFGIVINQQGFKTEFVALNDNNNPQFYTLKDGEQVITDDWQIANTMLKPQRVDNTWVETATAEEIAEWEANQPKSQPSQQDTLNAQLLIDNASMKAEINNQKALNSQLLLEIAKLKGGTTNV